MPKQVDRNGTTEFVPPLPAPDKEAKGTLFGVQLNQKRTGGGAHNLAYVTVGPDIRIGKENPFPNLKSVVLFCHKAPFHSRSGDFLAVLLAQTAPTDYLEKPEFLDRRKFVLIGMMKQKMAQLVCMHEMNIAALLRRPRRPFSHGP